jgi:hypothetical protein
MSTDSLRHKAGFYLTEVQVPTAPPAQKPAQGMVLSTFTTADFSSPGTCTMCYAGLSDEAGTDVSLTTDWRSTRMAN